MYHSFTGLNILSLVFMKYWKVFQCWRDVHLFCPDWLPSCGGPPRPWRGWGGWRPAPADSTSGNEFLFAINENLLIVSYPPLFWIWILGVWFTFAAAVSPSLDVLFAVDWFWTMITDRSSRVIHFSETFLKNFCCLCHPGPGFWFYFALLWKKLGHC